MTGLTTQAAFPGDGSGLTKLEYLAAQLLATGDSVVQDDIKWAFDMAEAILQESARRQQVERDVEKATRKRERESVEEEKRRAPFYVQTGRSLRPSPHYWVGVGRVGFEDDRWAWYCDDFATDAEAMQAGREWAGTHGALAPPFQIVTSQHDSRWLAKVYPTAAGADAAENPDIKPSWTSQWRATESHARSDAQAWVDDETSGRGHPGPDDQ